MAITLENRKQKSEAGFALLIAVIFMSVMLAFGLSLASLSYKQQVLASYSIQSQYAFYAADAGLECTLYEDQQQDLFNYSSHSLINPPNSITCGGASAMERLSYTYDSSRLALKERLSLDSGTRCADVTVYKPAPGTGVNYIFSQGYNVSCAMVSSPNGTRFVTRGLHVRY